MLCSYLICSDDSVKETAKIWKFFKFFQLIWQMLLTHSSTSTPTPIFFAVIAFSEWSLQILILQHQMQMQYLNHKKIHQLNEMELPNCQ